ncbi:MAG: hypothetical protein UV36_C0029G0002 [Parcubacteria group bacterium GW2011_GWC2_42_6]|nr:MAG: hypothetical protein UV36_C0029G0002 [Parcubacteria group bacterium GW2011_GWC2_42_6]
MDQKIIVASGPVIIENNKVLAMIIYGNFLAAGWKILTLKIR